MSHSRCRTCHFAPCRCDDLASGCFVAPSACRRNKPSASQSLKINRRNIPNALKEAKRHGVPTDFTQDGRPIFESRGHKKAYLGMINRDTPADERITNLDGGYGD